MSVTYTLRLNPETMMGGGSNIKTRHFEQEILSKIDMYKKKKLKLKIRIKN